MSLSAASVTGGYPADGWAGRKSARQHAVTIKKDLPARWLSPRPATVRFQPVVLAHAFAPFRIGHRKVITALDRHQTRV